MRILFCDDNPEIVELLQSVVSEYFEQHSLPCPEYASYTSGDALVQAEERADIAFLDVEMPGLNGIQVGAMLKEKNPSIKILVVTAYPDYLDEAMKFHVFRYLSKPIDKERLFRNLKDALYQYNMESREYPIETESGVYVVRAEEILCAEAAMRKVVIHTTAGDFPSTKPMSYWQETLTLPCFHQTHRSYIVNMRFVSTIEKDRVLLKQGTASMYAYLTRRKYTAFKQAYLLYMESVK